MLEFLLLALTLDLLFGPAAPESGAATLPSRGDGWEVAVDPSIGDGCYAVHRWPSGEILRVGLNPVADTAYLVIGKKAWRSLEPGESYALELQLGDEELRHVAATGLRFGSGDPQTYLFAETRDFLLLDELAGEDGLLLFYGGRMVADLDLSGVNEMMPSLFACQALVRDRRQEESDPFAPSRSSPERPPRPHAAADREVMAALTR